MTKAQSTPVAAVSGIPRSGGHVGALDGLRAIAALCVLLFHARSYQAFQVWEHAKHITWFADRGIYGVDVFFVLSGFLITGVLLRARSATNLYKAFYVRRLLRIVPIYWVTLAVIFSCYVGARVTFYGPDPAWFWFNLSNWVTIYQGHPILVTHFWSLGVEEQFYLLWPLLVRRCRASVLLWLCCGTAAAEYLLRLTPWVAGQMHWHPEFVHRSLYLHSYGLLIGSALALLFEVGVLSESRAMVVRFYSVATGLLFALSMLARSSAIPAAAVARGMLCSLFIAGLIAHIVLSREGFCSKVLAISPLRRLGRCSYAFYIVHLPLLRAFQICIYHYQVRFFLQQRLLPVYVFTLVVVLASTAVAALSWHLLEAPILGLKRFFMFEVRREV